MRATPFDIFRKDLLGTPVWMEAVEDLETARRRVTELAGRSPGEYFVFSQETEEIVLNTPTRMYELAVPTSVSEIWGRWHGPHSVPPADSAE